MRTLKTGCFVLEWLNIYAVCYYFNFVFFQLRSEHGFGNKENLLFAALNGFLYIFGSWFGGKFAQARGNFASLSVGFSIMAVAMACGLGAATPVAHTLVMVGWTLGICFTWPALEALAAESSSRTGLTRMVGIYNVVWASGAALAYFTGGTLLEWLGPRSLYWLPASVHVVQLVLVWWLHGVAKAKSESPHPLQEPLRPSRLCGERKEEVNRRDAKNAESKVEGFNARIRSGNSLPLGGGEGVESAGEVKKDSSAYTQALPADAGLFLKLAWVANPFAYIAMNTIIPLIPDLAAKLGLSTAAAGCVASVWMFARLGAFAVLWWWPGWHYRFGWLAGAYVLMGASFAALLLVPSLAVIIVAQLIFGVSVGLIYYSSLFYSMDVGETKGEHGGFHEALIGMGLFGGPAVGAVTMHFLPGRSAAGIWAVTALLLVGLVVLLWMRRRTVGKLD